MWPKRTSRLDRRSTRLRLSLIAAELALIASSERALAATEKGDRQDGAFAFGLSLGGGAATGGGIARVGLDAEWWWRAWGVGAYVTYLPNVEEMSNPGAIGWERGFVAPVLLLRTTEQPAFWYAAAGAGFSQNDRFRSADVCPSGYCGRPVRDVRTYGYGWRITAGGRLWFAEPRTWLLENLQGGADLSIEGIGDLSGVAPEEVLVTVNFELGAWLGNR